MNVDESRPKSRGVHQLVAQNLDGTVEKDLVGPRQVHQVRGVDRERPDVELGQTLAKSRCFGRWLGSPPPRGRVVAEYLQRRGADLAGAFGDLQEAASHGQMRSRPAATGQLHPPAELRLLGCHEILPLMARRRSMVVSPPCGRFGRVCTRRR